MLEEAVAALTKAVQENTAVLKGMGGAKPAEAPKQATEAKAVEAKKEEPKAEAPKPAGPKKPTIEDTRAALKAFQAIEGREAAIDIIKALGADTLADLDPDKYAEAIAKTKEEK